MKKEDDKVTSFFDRSNRKQKTRKTKNTKRVTSKTTKINKMAVSKKKLVTTSLKTKKRKKKQSIFRKNKTENKGVLLFKKGKNLKKNQSKKTNRVNYKKGNLLERIINILLIIFIFTLPLFVTRQTFQGINFEKSLYFIVFGAIILLLNLFKALISREIKIQKTFLDKYFLLFIFIYGLSTWFSVDRWHSLVGFFGDPSRGMIEILFIGIFFYLVLSNFSLEIAKRAYWAIIWVVILISVYTLLSGLAIVPQIIQTKLPFSFIGSTVGLTVFLSMGIPLLATAFLELNNSKNKKFTTFYQFSIFVALIIILFDLIILKTFMAWTGLLSGIIVLSFLVLGQKPKQKGKFVQALIFTIFAILIIIAGLANSNQRGIIPTLSKVGLPNEIRVGLPVSYNIIKNSLKSGVKQSLLGSGPATFGYDFAKFHSGGAMSMLFSNLYQGDGIISEGIPTVGLFAIMIVFLTVISFLIKALQLASSRKQSRLYLFGLFSASIVWLSNAFLGQIDAGILFVGVIILTLTTYFILENSKNKKTYYTIRFQKFSLPAFFGVTLILGGIGFAVTSIAYASKFYSADKFLNQAMNDKDIDRNIQNIKQASRLNPQEGVYYTKLGQAYLIAAEKKNINKPEKEKINNNEQVKKNIINSLAFLRQGAKLMPNDVRALRSLALTYKFIGDTKSAEKVYQQLITLEPNGLEYYISLGDMQLTNLKENKDNKLNKAIKFYKQALNINPRASDVYYKLALAYSQKNDIDNSLNNIVKAVQLAPNNELYKFTLGIFLQNRGGEKDKINAEKIYKSLLAVNPQSIDVQIQLGALYEQTNRLDEAKAEYKKVIEIIGDKKGYQKIRQAMEKFINNLNEGKLNVPNKIISENDKKIKKEEDLGDINITGPAVTDNPEEAGQEELGTSQTDSKIITIIVDSEGPINVRSEGSLSGKKLTKIKNTGQFKKLQQKGQWVQIIIPADDEHQEEVVGWVHSKFVTE